MKILMERNYGIECAELGLPNRLNVSLYYTKGGYNGWTNERRGYYLSITPLCGNTYRAYTGQKVCIKEVQRKTKRATEEVVKNYWNYFRDFVVFDFAHSLCNRGRSRLNTPS